MTTAPSQPSPGFATRIGEILTAPRAALARIDATGGGLRDALWLVLVGVLTIRLPELLRAILMLTGPTSGALMRVAALAVDEIRQGAWVVLPAAVVVTTTAGRRRDSGRDLDLGAACYVPYFAVHALARVIDAFAGMQVVSEPIVQAAGAIAAAFVLVPAVRLARSRAPEAPAAPTTGDVVPPPVPPPDPRGRKAGTWLLTLAGLALVANVLWSARHFDALRPIRKGEAAPAFALPRIDGTGGQVALDSFRGKVVVLDFWATWCAPCVAMLPVMDKVHATWAPRGVGFVGINSDGGGATPDQIRGFLDAHHIPYPVVVDDGQVGALYKVEALPTLVVVGRDGSITRSFIGFTSQGALERAIQEAGGG